MTFPIFIPFVHMTNHIVSMRIRTLTAINKLGFKLNYDYKFLKFICPYVLHITDLKLQIRSTEKTMFCFSNGAGHLRDVYTKPMVAVTNAKIPVQE